LFVQDDGKPFFRLFVHDQQTYLPASLAECHPLQNTLSGTMLFKQRRIIACNLERFTVRGKSAAI
jgi:hypothetical protein